MVDKTFSNGEIKEIDENIGQFDFSEGIQDSIFYLMLHDINYLKQFIYKFKPNYFTGRIRQIFFKAIVKYCKKYGTDKSLNTYLKDIILEYKNYLTKDELDLLIDYVKNIKELHINENYVIDKIKEFFKKEAIRIGFEKAYQYYQNKQYEKAKEIFLSSYNVSIWKNDILDVLDTTNIEERLQKTEYEIACKFGIPTLDELIGGIYKKTLTVIMAKLNVGKSWFAVHLGNACASEGKTVLHISTEMTLEGVDRRYIQNLCSLSYKKTNYNVYGTELENNNIHTFDDIDYIRDTLDILKAQGGSILLKSYAPNTFSFYNLENLLTELELQNIFPDLVIIDDILNMKHYSNKKERRHELFNTAVNLSRIAKERNIGLVITHQANRTGFNIKTIDSEHSAEDIGIIRLADLGLSLNSTKEEYFNNTARIYIMRNRLGIKGVEIKIYQDFSTGQFCIGDELINEEE